MVVTKLRLTTLMVLLLAIYFKSNSQTNDDVTIQGNSININENETDDYSYLMLNISYANNNIEYLTGITEKIPSTFSSLSYIHKSGLYTGLYYSNYFNTETQTYDYEIEAGYQKYFNDVFDIDMYYNWHQFKGDTLLEGLNYDNSVNLSLGLDIDFIYFSTDLSYLVGKTDNFFLDVNISKFMVIDKIFFKSDYLMISPTISAAFGTDLWLYEDMIDSEKIILVNNLKLAGYSTDEFSFEGFNLLLPVSYAINNVALSFSYMYKIPSKKYKELGWENKSAFMISLTWFINFNK